MTRLRTAYLVVANTAILAWAGLIGTYVVVQTVEYFLPSDRPPPLTDTIARVYAPLGLDDIRDLRRVAWAHGFRYESVVGSVPAPIKSRFLNVDEHGIRAGGQPPRDISSLNGAVWMLGGSTTFGFGIADHETIPARLEGILGRPVINLGVPGFTAGDENRWLNHYLRLGYRPAAAIFMDGINENCEPDTYRDSLTRLYEIAQKPYFWDLGRPLVQAFDRAGSWVLRRLGAQRERAASLSCEASGRRNPLRTLLVRALRERAALCDLYGVDCQTFVQPFAGIHARIDGYSPDTLARVTRESRDLFTHLAPGFEEAGADFLTDALSTFDRHAFIDEAHYSAEASGIIAATIAERLHPAARRQVAVEP